MISIFNEEEGECEYTLGSDTGAILRRKGLEESRDFFLINQKVEDIESFKSEEISISKLDEVFKTKLYEVRHTESQQNQRQELFPQNEIQKHVQQEEMSIHVSLQNESSSISNENYHTNQKDKEIFQQTSDESFKSPQFNEENLYPSQFQSIKLRDQRGESDFSEVREATLTEYLKKKKSLMARKRQKLHCSDMRKENRNTKSGSWTAEGELRGGDHTSKNSCYLTATYNNDIKLSRNNSQAPQNQNNKGVCVWKHFEPDPLETKRAQTLGNYKKVQLVKRFAHRIIRLSQNYYFKRVKPLHLHIIGDVLKREINSSEKQKNYCFNKFCIKPNDNFSLVWELLEIVFLFFHVIAFGFLFAFNIPLNDYVQIFSIVFYLLDLIIITNTGYYQGVEIITDKLKIIKFNSFNISMCIISLCALVLSDKGPLQFVFIFRLKQLYRSYHHFEQNFAIRQKFPISATLIHLLLITILLAHYNACAFYFFSLNFSNLDQSWLSNFLFSGYEWHHTYIAALYFSFITMVTVGYGDIVPKTTGERVYTIFFVLISAITFAYVVNTIGSLFQEMSIEEGKYVQKKYEIVKYMERRNISKSIQISVVKFLEYTISQEKELQNSVEGESFLQSIPIKLRQQVYQEYYGGILKNIKIFSLNFSQEFLSQLSLLMKEKTFGPGEEIIKQSDSNDTFFFINQGQVEFEIELPNKNIVHLGTLQKGESFNHKGLFVDISHEVTARCRQITQIIFLNKNDFLSVLKQNKDQYVNSNSDLKSSLLNQEKYCMLREQYMIGRLELGEKCLSCEEFGHKVLSCRFIGYNPDKSSLIAKAQHSEDMRAKIQFKRDSQKRINALMFNEEVRQALRYYRYEQTNEFQDQQNIEYHSFSELIEQKLSDEQFFRAFPQIYQNSEQFLIVQSDQQLQDYNSINLLEDSNKIQVQDDTRNSSEEEMKEEEIISKCSQLKSSGNADNEEIQQMNFVNHRNYLKTGSIDLGYLNSNCNINNNSNNSNYKSHLRFNSGSFQFDKKENSSLIVQNKDTNSPSTQKNDVGAHQQPLFINLHQVETLNEGGGGGGLIPFYRSTTGATNNCYTPTRKSQLGQNHKQREENNLAILNSMNSIDDSIKKQEIKVSEYGTGKSFNIGTASVVKEDLKVIGNFQQHMNQVYNYNLNPQQSHAINNYKRLGSKLGNLINQQLPYNQPLVSNTDIIHSASIDNSQNPLMNQLLQILTSFYHSSNNSKPVHINPHFLQPNDFPLQADNKPHHKKSLPNSLIQNVNQLMQGRGQLTKYNGSKKNRKIKL